jgi:transcriptional regulator with XRE-family HTH domain
MIKTVEHWLESNGLSLADVAERARLPIDRVAAIAEGRWTPSPDERQRIAGAFGVPVEQVSWGHTASPRIIRYGRYGLKEDFNP